MQKTSNIFVLYSITSTYTFDKPSTGMWENFSKFWNTFVQDYSDAATVHGVSYICQRDQSAPHRLLWLLIVSMGVFVTRMRISFEDSSSGDDDFLQGQNSSKVNLIVTARDCSSFATIEAATKIQMQLKHLTGTSTWIGLVFRKANCFTFQD